MAVRAANQRLVEAWNSAAASSSSSNGAAGRGFRLALNRFADWLPEEYAGLMTAKRSSSRSEAVKVRQGQHGRQQWGRPSMVQPGTVPCMLARATLQQMTCMSCCACSCVPLTLLLT